MTDISKTLREKLKQSTEISFPKLLQNFTADDGCHKWIVEVASGSCVEMVYIPEAGRGTLCISSQAGCSLDCSFCATGKQGFNSNLTVAEIVGQLWWANQKLGGFDSSGNRVVTNVVMMGMGEPLLNFDNVMEAVSIMMEDCAYGLSKRKVTISTSGVVPAIDRLKDFTDASLAVSLHAPNDELRNRLVPVNDRIGITAILEAADEYFERTGRRVTYEYVLLAETNDQPRHARQLAALLSPRNAHVNLIPMNTVDVLDWTAPGEPQTQRFATILQEAGVATTVRKRKGADIDAACGQLRLEHSK